MKRLNTLLVVLVTLSMLVVPLASATTMSPAAAGQETLSTQPPTEDAASLAQPAPQMTLAQPSGEGPVLSVDGTGQQPAPAMSIAQPAEQGNVMAAQEPVAPAFELVSVVRSCEDLTRFDLTWTGTGTISSIAYVLYNSSDNGSTPGTINGADIVGTTASITGRPGDRSLSLDVAVADGVYRYLVDAEVCGISDVNILEQPVSKPDTVVVPTAIADVPEPSVDASSLATPSTATTNSETLSTSTSTTQRVSFNIVTSGAPLPYDAIIRVTDSNGAFVEDVYERYTGMGRTRDAYLAPGSYNWAFPARGVWQATSGSFVVTTSPLVITVTPVPDNNGMINLSIQFPDDLTNRYADISVLDSQGRVTNFYTVQRDNGTIQVGPLAYGDYTVSVSKEGFETVSTVVGVYADEVLASLTLPRPDTVLLDFVVIDEGAPTTNASLVFYTANVWNGTGGTQSVPITGPGTYTVEFVMPKVGEAIFYNVYGNVFPYTSMSGEWHLGDDEDVVIRFANPAVVGTFDVVVRDEESGEVVPHLEMYFGSRCPQRIEMVPADNSYQLRMYDDVSFSCELQLRWGAYTTVGSWWISDPGDGQVIELTVAKKPEFATGIVVHVDAPEGVGVRSVYFRHPDNTNRTWWAEVDAEGNAHFPAIEHGEWEIHVYTHDFEFLYQGLVNDSVTVSEDGQQFLMTIEPATNLTTVTLTVKTADGSALPGPVTVSLPCTGVKCGGAPILGEVEPTGSSVDFPFQWPIGRYLHLSAGAPGGYLSSAVTVSSVSDNQHLTLILQPITTLPAVATASLSSNSGIAGSTVTVSGGGYIPGETVTIAWDSPTGTILGTVQASATGVISKPVVIPGNVQGRTYTVHVVGTSQRAASTTYTVRVASVSLLPLSGRAGTLVTVSGSGFKPGESVSLRWGSASGPVLGSVVVKADGTFSGKITVPAYAGVGMSDIHAISTGGSAVASYDVTALAVVKVTLNPTSGRAGTVTAVSGSGYQPGEAVTIRWGGPTGTLLGSVKASATGTIAAKVTVPATAAPGTFGIHATGTSGQTGNASYQVTALAIVKVTLSPISGRAGTVTSVTGSGYRPGESVTIRWSTTTGTLLGSVKATTSGTISAKVTVPATAAVGTFRIYATGTSGQAGSATYQVTALAIVKVALSPTYGRAGTVTTVTGSGFRPGETVTIRWGGATGTILGSVRATTSGTISAKVTVPATAALGTFTIRATGAAGQLGTAPYKVTALAIVKITLSPASGRAGTVTTVSGSGFRPGETVTIRWNSTTGTLLGSVKATASGTISAKVTVPRTATIGTFTIRATGASGQTGYASYKVTALALYGLPQWDTRASTADRTWSANQM